MNFFAHQDRARQNTQKLIWLFVVSIVGMIFCIYFAAIVTFNVSPLKSWMSSSNSIECVEIRSEAEPTLTYVSRRSRGSSNFSRSRSSETPDISIPSYRRNYRRSCAPKQATLGGWWQPQLFFWVTISTIGLIGGAAWYKLSTLQAGGSAIARELGGRLLLPESVTSEEEHQLLNVVEEMAIAAGMSVPAVYVLDQETAINAFAAGYTPKDAVIGVTRGTLQQLNRDELQGVIGHEFSHILNGDMRLNLNLVSALFGIFFVYLSGRLLLETRYDRDNPLWVFGLALCAIGGLGLFFGRLIQSAASRQREFLADASAVQFTRNPSGIAGALEKISGHSSRLISPYAETASHMFFGNGVKTSWLDDLFATHPPLEKRIQRLHNLPEGAIPRVSRLSSHSLENGVMGFASSSPSEVVNQVGTVAPEHFAHAQGLLAQLPEAIRSSLRNQKEAISIIYALAFEPKNTEIRTEQIEFLRQTEFSDTVEQTLNFYTEIEALDPRIRLPLLDLTIPALRQSSEEDHQNLFKSIQGLAKVDGRWSLHEFILFLVLQNRLNSDKNSTEQFTTIDPIWLDCLNVLSALARVGNSRKDDIIYGFRSGAYRLPNSSQRELPEIPPSVQLSDLKKSLDRLKLATPKLKQSIVDAFAHMILLDNTVTVEEADLLRAIVIAIDCPIPPFLNATSSTQKSRKISKA
jgi:Zn-dependent protease with chaperone function